MLPPKIKNDPKAIAEARALMPIACRTCGMPVELARRCYAIPTCYACLPPPPPLAIIEVRRG